MDKKFLIKNIDLGTFDISQLYNLFYEHDQRYKKPLGELLLKKGIMLGYIEAQLNEKANLDMASILSEAIQIGAWLNWSGRVKFNTEVKEEKVKMPGYV